MIRFKQTGNFKKTERLFKKVSEADYIAILDRYAKRGVDALSKETPVDSGLTAMSWGYEIVKQQDGYRIYWTNNNVNKGVSIALIIQNGHGTRNGGYVVGRDYINPAIRPIFDSMANSAWEEVTSIG